jgi:hypothetical protein
MKRAFHHDCFINLPQREPACLIILSLLVSKLAAALLQRAAQAAIATCCA